MNRQERRRLARQGVSKQAIEAKQNNDIYEQGHRDRYANRD